MRKVNPEGPEEKTPYPDEKPRNAGTDTWRQNMYSQGGQHGRNGRFPWPEGASNSDGDGRRRSLPRSISGRY
jgi:hypothetical protein